MALALLYFCNCDHKFSVNLAFFCHESTKNFMILAMKKITAALLDAINGDVSYVV